MQVSTKTPTVAYFSMEIALDSAIPTYSGGLGVLSGDTLRAAADLGVPVVAITLLYRRGYFKQHLDQWGNQTEAPAQWFPEQTLEPTNYRVTITLEGRQVHIRAWKYTVYGISGHSVPVYLLDADLPENSDWDRTLSDHLYGGDGRYRLAQEVVLGIGGVAILRALGHKQVQTYHMNEGHSALLVLALLEEQVERGNLLSITHEDIEAVRQRCMFTTHTPVPAGHDRFSIELVRNALGENRANALLAGGYIFDNSLNMTYLALHLSRYVNAVALRHREISVSMFPNYPIDAITNGVHAVTWTSRHFRRLYDKYIPEWRKDNLYLRYAVNIPRAEIEEAHALSKQDLFTEVERRTKVRLDPRKFTIAFARRATGYKRMDLLFKDIERLKSIAHRVGPLQIVYAGKSHPRDEQGKALIRRVHEAAGALRHEMPVVYLEDYDMTLGLYLSSGVDLWLNNPQKPLEASGTSGMKAALNGVPSLSVLDGWWIEGHIEGVTGWAIGDDRYTASDAVRESISLYDKLEHTVLPLYYNDPGGFTEVRRSSIMFNGSFFNTQRMVQQYVEHAYMAPANNNGHRSGNAAQRAPETKRAPAN